MIRIDRAVVSRMIRVGAVSLCLVQSACSTLELEDPQIRVRDMRGVSFGRGRAWSGDALVIAFDSHDDLTSERAAITMQARCYLDDDVDETRAAMGGIVRERTAPDGTRHFGMYFPLSEEDGCANFLAPEVLRSREYEHLRFHLVDVSMVLPVSWWPRSEPFVVTKSEVVNLLDDAGIR